MDDYDVVVVGAGCSGAVFSARMASRGFRVLVIERGREEEIGQARCDFVESDAFELSMVEPPSPPEAKEPPRFIEVISPDVATKVKVSDFRLRQVDRRLLGRRLIEEAREAGAEIRTQCISSGLEIEKGMVVSVNTDRGTFPCKIAVDASGLDRVLCRSMPGGTGIPRLVRASDYLSVYRETRNLDPEGSSAGVRRRELEYYIGLYGGYSWVYADDENSIDVGTAVQDIQGSPDPRDIVLGYIRSSPAVGEDVIYSGGGRIPTRRPLNTMVASGFMVIGDAACQANPLIGRGVGGAMVAGETAADAAAFALEAGDVSTRGLWSYNHDFMRDRGAQMAALECVKLFLQGLSENEFSWSLAKGVIDEQEIAGALSGRFEVPGSQFKLKSLVKGIRSIPLLVRFESLLRLAQKALELYRQYPREYDPPEYAEWSQQADYLFEDVEKV